MSFFALNIGTQQTCNELGKICGCYENVPHSFKCLSCFVDNDYIELLGTELVTP